MVGSASDPLASFLVRSLGEDHSRAETKKLKDTNDPEWDDGFVLYVHVGI
jgi:hypothetical protein